MSAGNIDNALSRIDTALARIERASARTPTTDGDLAVRHARLRAAVGDSLRELDALLVEPRE